MSRRWICLLACTSTWASADLQIGFDPMRPVPLSAPAVPGTNVGRSLAPRDGPAPPSTPAPPAGPVLKITRLDGTGRFSALIDQTWVHTNDLVAGYRVTALRADSAQLQSVGKPVRQLTLRLHPWVSRREPTPTTPSTPTGAATAEGHTP